MLGIITLGVVGAVLFFIIKFIIWLIKKIL